jgi:MFS family permease
LTATTSSPVTRVRESAGFLLAILTLLNVINWADRQVVPILFPGIRADLGLSDVQLGLIGGFSFTLVYALSAFLFGYLGDRHIRRNLITFGLVMWSLAMAAGGLATGFWTLFIARFLTGIGEAALYPCAMSLIGERFDPGSRGKALGVFMAAVAVGGGVGIGLGGSLAESVGWRQVFFIYGAAGFALVPLILAVPEKPRPETASHEESSREVVGEALRDPRLLFIWMAGLVMIACGLGYGAWAPSFFVREHGFDVTQAGLLVGAGQLAGGVLGALIGGFASDRAKKRRIGGEADVSTFAALIAIPIISVVVFSSSTTLLYAFGIVGPVAIFAFFPGLQAAIMDVVPQHRHGLVFAIQSFFLGGIGSGLGPLVVGAISDVSGSLRIALASTLIGMAVAALIAFMAGRAIRAAA